MDLGAGFLLVFSVVCGVCCFFLQTTSGCCIFKKHDEFSEKLLISQFLIDNPRLFFNCGTYFLFFSLSFCSFWTAISIILFVFFITNINAAYFKHFKEILSFSIVKNNFKESIVLFRYSRSFFCKKTFLFSVIVAIGQIIGMLLFSRFYKNQGAGIVFYVVLMLWLIYLVKINFEHLAKRIFTGGQNIVIICNYIGVLTFWFVEIVMSRFFVEKYDKSKARDDFACTDLAEIKHFSCFDKICFLQIESLDAAILENEKIAPFLHKLKDKSVFCKIRKSPFQSGSADADFQMLFGDAPVEEKTIMYKIKGYDFSHPNSLPKKMKSLGFKCEFFHNYKQNYYNRKNCLRRASFDKMFFAEDMIADKNHAGFFTFDTVNDDTLFDSLLVGLKANENEKYFQFAITCSSHNPFVFLKPEQKLVYCDGEDVTLFQKYANSIMNVDENIRRFYDKLSAGTLLVIYGDHNSGVAYDGNDCETIPFLLNIKGEDLSGQMILDKHLACSGDLFFINIVKWIHQKLI